MDLKTTNNLLVLFFALVVLAGLIFVVLWIIQVAFGYFGFEFTLWQSFVILLASTLLFKTYWLVPAK